MKALLKSFLIIATLIVGANYAIADTTQSRDGDGQKIQGPAYGSIRSVSLGTNGFKCWSTGSKMSWEVKVTATTSTDGSALGFKYFINGDETVVYPVSSSFFQWQNAPKSQSPTVVKACMRVYSSATLKTGSGLFQ